MAPKKGGTKIDPALQKLVKSLTESGTVELDQSKTDELIELCRSSPVSVLNVFTLVSSQLQKPHAEIRWSAFLLSVKMFEIFKSFRECLVDKIKDFIHQVIQFDPDKPLPPPKPVAARLSSQACKTISTWRQTYGKEYVEIELIYKFMQNVYKINFEAPVANIAPSPADERKKRIKELQLKNATSELESKLTEVSANLNEFWTCLKLILPSPDQFDFPLGVEAMPVVENVQSNFSPNSVLREAGYLPGATVSIIIPGSKNSLIIEENEDNSAVLENLRSCYLALSKHQLPVISGLLEKISRLGSSDNVLKLAIDAKTNLNKAKETFERMNIKWLRKAIDYKAEDDEEDWVDVAVDEEAGKALSADNILQTLIKKQSEPKVAGGACESSGLSSESKLGNTESSKIPTLLLAEIPTDIVSLDPAFAMLHSKEDNIWCNRTAFDADSSGGKATNMLVEALSTRPFYYVSKEDKSIEVRTCGAPLGNGKFCPRKDKIKCPFHGLIGASSSSSTKLDDIPSTSSVSNWRDVGLERDISVQLGIDLTGPTSNNRKRTGLTNLKPDNPKKRIAKKISSGAERVAYDMNRLDKKRHNDKFAHSFNYSLSQNL